MSSATDPPAPNAQLRPSGYYSYFGRFNAQAFWDAHEVLEDVWREHGRDRFLQGLILFAAAFVHVQNNNPAGCRKVMAKAVRWLEPYVPRRWELDVAPIVAYGRWVLEQVDRLPAGSVLAEHIPFITLNPEPDAESDAVEGHRT